MRKFSAGVISFLVLPLSINADMTRQKEKLESRFHRISPIFPDGFSVLPLPLGTLTPAQTLADGAEVVGIGALGGGLGVAVFNTLPLVRSSPLARQAAFIGRDWAVYGKISGQTGRERLLHLGNLATGVAVGAVGVAVSHIAYGNAPERQRHRLIVGTAASSLIWGAGSAIRVLSWRAFLPGFISGVVAGASAATLTEYLSGN